VNLFTLGGRRFLITIGAGLVTALLQWFSKLDPAGMAYTGVILGTVGAFIAGNVVETLKGKKDASV